MPHNSKIYFGEEMFNPFKKFYKMETQLKDRSWEKRKAHTCTNLLHGYYKTQSYRKYGWQYFTAGTETWI